MFNKPLLLLSVRRSPHGFGSRLVGPALLLLFGVDLAVALQSTQRVYSRALIASFYADVLILIVGVFLLLSATRAARSMHQALDKAALNLLMLSPITARQLFISRLASALGPLWLNALALTPILLMLEGLLGVPMPFHPLQLISLALISLVLASLSALLTLCLNPPLLSTLLTLVWLMTVGSLLERIGLDLPVSLTHPAPTYNGLLIITAGIAQLLCLAPLITVFTQRRVGDGQLNAKRRAQLSQHLQASAGLLLLFSMAYAASTQTLRVPLALCAAVVITPLALIGVDRLNQSSAQQSTAPRSISRPSRWPILRRCLMDRQAYLLLILGPIVPFTALMWHGSPRFINQSSRSLLWLLAAVLAAQSYSVCQTLCTSRALGLSPLRPSDLLLRLLLASLSLTLPTFALMCLFKTSPLMLFGAPRLLFFSLLGATLGGQHSTRLLVGVALFVVFIEQIVAPPLLTALLYTLMSALCVCRFNKSWRSTDTA